ncbi:MAG: EpsG family protein, partial [Lachnospiraceae bacterium]|nr:EpsG family protein [Lachnospiraceae bacterium]
MILYLLIAALSIGVACLVNNRRLERELIGRSSTITRRQGMNSLSLLSVFLILFLPAALRLEVGNDYESYVDTIHEIYVGGYVVTEPLFNAIVKLLCELSGGENYLLVFAFFSFLTLWIFLKVIYEQTEEFAFSFYLF